VQGLSDATDSWPARILAAKRAAEAIDRHFSLLETHSEIGARNRTNRSCANCSFRSEIPAMPRSIGS